MNGTAAGRKDALELITENMTAEEAANLEIRRANGRYRAFVVDAGRIDMTSASPAYAAMVSLISDKSYEAKIGVVGGGLSATFDSPLGRVSSSSFGSGVYGDSSVLVSRDDSGIMLKVQAAGGGETDASTPLSLVMAHELFGETLKYRSGYRNLRMDPVADSEEVIRRENAIRAWRGMPLRTGSDHGILTVR